MTELTCTTCGAANTSEARFCARCGTALPMAAAAPATPAGIAPAGAPTGWDLATAAMAQEPPPVDASRRTPFADTDYASWGARLGGALIDALIEGGIAFAVAFAGGAVWGASDPEGSQLHINAQDDVYFAVIGVWVLFALAFFVVWEVLWTRGKGMGKPGMRIAGFRVATRTGERVGFGRAVGRAFSKCPYLLGWLGLGPLIASAITIGASKRHQALHDLMSGTVCIKERSLTERGMGPGTEGGVPEPSPQYYAQAQPGAPTYHPPLPGAVPPPASPLPPSYQPPAGPPPLAGPP
ncbi:MAG: hypothetical protein JWN72_1787, partial [Thermoleophilia bacterium]|nr:hypothetical protein [Thermoleophilia bacterium]